MTTPAMAHFQITPSDSETLPNDILAIVIVDGGDVALEDRFGTSLTYDDVPAMTTFSNFRPRRVLATGTTATKIIAWRPAG